MKHTAKRIVAAILTVAMLLLSVAFAATRTDIDVAYSGYMGVAYSDESTPDDVLDAANVATVDMVKIIADLVGAKAEDVEAFATADDGAILIAKTLEKDADPTDAIAAWAIVVNHFDETIIVQKGDKGDTVKQLQNGLIAHDENALPKFGADGSFGDEGVAGVTAFQTANGLNETGMADVATFTLATDDTNDGVYALMFATANSLDDGRSINEYYTTTEYIAMANDSIHAEGADAASVAAAKLDMAYVIAILLLGGNATFDAADMPEPNTLRVTNTVINAEGATLYTDDVFRFTVTLTKPEGQTWTEEEYTIGDTEFAAEDAPEADAEGEDEAEAVAEAAPATTIVATVEIANGARVDFTDLPTGTTYTVTEAAPEGYTATVSGAIGTAASGVITDTDAAVVDFLNVKAEEKIENVEDIPEPKPELPPEVAHSHTWVDVTEVVQVPEEGHWETVHYPAGSHTETIHHPEEGHYETIHHPAVTHTETIQHPAEYRTETVQHPEEGHYETRHHDAVTHTEQKWVETKPAWDETVYRVICGSCGAQFTSRVDLMQHQAYNQFQNADGEWRYCSGYGSANVTVHHDAEGYYETVTVTDSPAWDEQVWVVDKKAWTETKQVLVKDAWTETKTVVDKAAWDEKVYVKDKDAWTETKTVIDKEAHDEQVWIVDKAATTTTKVTGQRCEVCGETKMPK